MVTNECRNCGEPFQAKNMRQSFCRVACRFEYEKAKAKENYARKKASELEGKTVVVIECRRCGVTFIPVSSGFKYCSPECRLAGETSRKKTLAKVKYKKSVEYCISHDWTLAECPFFSGDIEQDMGTLYA